MIRTFVITFLAFALCISGPAANRAVAARQKKHERNALRWLADYPRAMQKAKKAKKMLLVYFHASDVDPKQDKFQSETLSGPGIRKELHRYIVVKLPATVRGVVQDQEIALLDHDAFKELRHGPGFVIIDFSNPESGQYGLVVSLFPFRDEDVLSREQLSVVLNLPPGGLTQRTLIYAVRIHPDAPASTRGEFSPVLAQAAEKHSLYQASITLQGHHHWNRRFHELNKELAGGLMAQEVCAESWPGEGLVEGAIECVHSWRQSPGHWGAVSAPSPLYAYDMKRGTNGVWYATGLFARQ